MDDLLERYDHTGIGYKPMLIRPGWQVAKLNYMPEQAIDGIVKIDVHRQTDEAFFLMNGTAILVLASIDEKGGKRFKCERMEFGRTYNIPKNVWHNIALQKDAEVIIVEKDGTHLTDFEFIYLNEKEKIELREMILLESSKIMSEKNNKF